LASFIALDNDGLTSYRHPKGHIYPILKYNANI